MKLKRYIFRLYYFGLRLYPKRFREAYGEEMLAMAYEILQIPRTSAQVLQVAFRLGADLIFTAAKQRAEQLRATTDKSRVRAAVLIPVQICCMLVATFLVVLPLVNVYTVMRTVQATAGPWYLHLVATAVPAIIMVLAFFLIFRLQGLSFWAKLKWAYAFGFSGALAYVVFATAADLAAQRWYPMLLPLWSNPTLVQAYGFDWTIAATACLSFYLIVAKVRRRIGTVK